MTTTFAYPWVLALLALVPLLAVVMFWPRLRKERRASFLFSRVDLVSAHGRGAASPKLWLEPVPDALKLVALGLLIVACARPQAVEPRELEVEGIDIYLALDMSGSMRAIDLDRAEVRQLENAGRRPVNRFEAAVATLQEFVEGRRHDRIGMTVFAKDAFLQFPLTLDYATILAMLARLRLGDIDEGGTAIGNALGRAVAGLKESEAKTKIVILITDGDRRGGNISPMQAAQIATDLGIKIYPILVGKDGATLVPVGRDLFSNRSNYRDMEFPVNPELLQEIARLTGGEYYRAADPESLREDLQRILDAYERSRITDEASVNIEERYVPWVVWAVLMLALAFALQHTLLRRFP